MKLRKKRKKYYRRNNTSNHPPMLSMHPADRHNDITKMNVAASYDNVVQRRQKIRLGVARCSLVHNVAAAPRTPCETKPKSMSLLPS